MKEYEIWMQGYIATGEHQRASFEGMATGQTFDEACIKLLGHRLDRDEASEDGYRRYGGRLCIWACCLFDNEKEARESFG